MSKMMQATPVETGKRPAGDSEGDAVPSDGVRIVAFACHYCAFAAADLAGVMRLSYEPSVKIIRLPCTGKLDHSYVLRAFERGVDGVFVAG